MSTKAMFRVVLQATFSVLILAANAVSQELLDAQVPVRVNVNATVKIDPPFEGVGTGDSGSVTANVAKNFNIKLAGADQGKVPQLDAEGGEMTSLPPEPANSKAFVSYNNGNITLNLQSQQYQNAVISLHSINGKQLLRSNVSASGEGNFNISNIPVGVYLLSVKGTKGNFFVTKLAFSGDGVNINATFSGGNNSQLMKAGDYGTWKITVSAPGYETQTRDFEPDAGSSNSRETFTLVRAASSSSVSSSSRSSSSGSSSSRTSSSSRSSSSGTFVGAEKKDFKEKVGSVEFDMVYIPGGTFTLGCESGCASTSAKPVSGVTVSNYFIMKTEVTTALWNAVMGSSGGSNSTSYASATWYDAFDFACKLTQKTGHNYRIMTEAEFEYAAKKPNKSGLLKIGDGSSIQGEEWAYNSWDVDKHTGGVDPVGPSSGEHTQKTRRDANGTGESNITSRLIRSIDGTGPSIRLVFSADVAYPPNYVPSCDIHPPHLGGEPVNSYRDPRWVTGSDKQWSAGAIAIGSISLNVWDDGTAKLGNTTGQWFTSNNFTFVFVPSSGSITKYAYIFLSEDLGSLISEKSFMSGGYVGRIEKKSVSSVTKPTVSGLKSGKELAQAQTNFATEFKMVDMENIPAADRKQDSRLLDGGDTKGWFQDNTSMSAAHHYRKDIDPDEFRFTVNQGNGRTVLAAGTWFTVNNTFLRVTHKNGYVAEYLYTIVPGSGSTATVFYHNSFIGYERADFRMFEIKTNGSSFPQTSCGNICSQEIPKGLTPVAQTGYQSTYTPPKCPTGGCN